AGDLDALPVYEETSYVPVDEEALMHSAASAAYAPAYYWYPYPGPIAAGWGERLYPAYPAVPPPGYTVAVKENIPEETVALKEGAKVVSRDGKHVGNVERVFTDPEADRATHFLVSKGLLLKEHKMIPADWVSSVSEDEIHLAVGSRLLEGLREYREPEHV
ncbi:MAG: DUF2171 domain-containing protein, partial [Anaerolineales bacterium]